MSIKPRMEVVEENEEEQNETTMNHEDSTDSLHKESQY